MEADEGKAGQGRCRSLDIEIPLIQTRQIHFDAIFSKATSDVEADEGRQGRQADEGNAGGGVSILNFHFYKPDKSSLIHFFLKSNLSLILRQTRAACRSKQAGTRQVEEPRY